MVSGFDIWGHDATLRRHWKGRFAAFFVDAAIAFIPTSLVLYFLGVDDIVLVGIATTAVFYLISSIPESLTGASVGKRIFGFRVHPVVGESLGGRACLRNITRAFWFILPPLDFAVGMATRGDPRQKLFDRLAGTKVVHISETERYNDALDTVAKNALDGGEKPGDEICRECNGKLLRLADEKLQCEKCGLIQ
ncbi:MAG: RDD family protein [Candidatus Thermoplasmatota archaeon]|nr:RDD family protein [Euryarchaeota archaeon]MBU4032924.1 RDD family protein [Candidatus Thermoplasmatota archaeon]MBU4070804.1 RDD family protein [Candidatus Thermoplasmatota archaeon]MBU4143525.1 RDD family protein [Candidatus Thermoplasmatota archaeon]MBU4591638.1 RDD family protein [Candidatus Thermoplasmatota archaeon]